MYSNMHLSTTLKPVISKALLLKYLMKQANMNVTKVQKQQGWHMNENSKCFNNECLVAKS